MRKSRIVLVYAVFLLWVGGCSEKYQPSECSVRFANFLIPSDSLEFALQTSNENSVIRETLGYKEVGEFRIVPTGKYQLMIHSAGKKILSKEWVAGKNDAFTVAAIGMLPEEPKLNEETRHNRLLEIFEGSVEESSNGGLPKVAVYLEHFEDKSDYGELKIVHLAPGFTDITIHASSGNRKQHLATLAYPEKSSSISLSPGSYKLTLDHKSSGIQLGSKSIVIKPGTLKTAFIAGFLENYPDSLDCIVLEN